MDYARELPLDKNHYPAALVPAKISNQSQRGTPLVSSVVTLSPNTTVLNVMVIGGSTAAAGVLGKWVTAAQVTSGASSVNSTNYDFMVNAGQNLSFVVPVASNGTGLQSIQGINPQLGLYPAVTFINATAQSASVFTAEY